MNSNFPISRSVRRRTLLFAIGARARLAGSASKTVLVAVAVLAVLVVLSVGGWYFGVEQPRQAALQRQAEHAKADAERQRSAEEKRLADEKARQDAETERLRRAAEDEKKKAEEKRKEDERLANTRGGLFITTRPAGAIVTVGESEVARSPAMFRKLKPGKQPLQIELEGYETVRWEVDIKTNDLTELGPIDLVRLLGRVRLESEPPGAKVKQGDKELGVTPLDLNGVIPETVTYRLALPGFNPTNLSGLVKPKELLKLLVKLERRPVPEQGVSWENSLGMRFVPVPGLEEALVSVWETRLQDFAAFAEGNSYDASKGMYSLGPDGWKQRGDWWKSPGFEQSPAHPVCGVSWQDAKAFCVWLTDKERKLGKLGPRQKYRLPTDAEWSKAVGLGPEAGRVPKEMSAVNRSAYPWGTQWPPPDKAGNYGGEESKTPEAPADWSVLAHYRDGYSRTAPVGSFAPNRLGLYDLGGNVWEWCHDYFDASGTDLVVRGGSWGNDEPETLLSSYRYHFPLGYRISNLGFRVVLDVPN